VGGGGVAVDCYHLSAHELPPLFWITSTYPRCVGHKSVRIEIDNKAAGKRRGVPENRCVASCR